MKILKEAQEAQAEKLKIFHSVFSRSQIIRLFANPTHPDITATEAEEAVQRHEARLAEIDKKKSPKAKEDQDKQTTNPVEEVVETFNEYTPVEDEEAVDHYVLQTKLLVTRLKTK